MFISDFVFKNEQIEKYAYYLILYVHSSEATRYKVI